MLYRDIQPFLGSTLDRIELVWDDKQKAAFKYFKATMSIASVLAYPSKDGSFVFSKDASDRIEAVMEKEQQEKGKVVRKKSQKVQNTCENSVLMAVPSIVFHVKEP